ncbi:2-iminoacetate synthase ThiH [Sphingobacterium athyrii]|uniref:2-iminoacetate synthase ThiH n=1 Tax=Sphingobacterium athyrii TaxID=2152717 RepID=A0A363NY41_9SPHI|nr:2-iminoacetate synthase ThiH [Sphingobacterium athyrii]PUV25724.1 2-iminoacetate synthase ThiH [Sphingobacterium athyrii]
MTDFKELLAQYRWEEVQAKIYGTSDRDVRHALNRDNLTLDDFIALISPAATPYLEQMAVKAQQITQRRFGKTIQLYAPLYLSNECQNICTYCGFSMDNKIRRKTLNNTELLLEAMALKSMGVNHVLLVSGEANKTVEINYFLRAIELLKPHFAQISIEVQPLELTEYQLLQAAGVYAVLVYQETYHREVYKTYHPKGKKSNFDYRLDTPDRIGQAGIHKIGLGVLLGLEDWRVDSFFTAAHIAYLQKNYWQTRYSISFPRLRPAAGSVAPNFHLSDKHLLQLICAYRLWNENLEISISTRENESFRDHIIPIGVTTMSAASKTNPGGYVVDPQALEQFEVSDERDMETIKNQIRKMGYAPVMKDWESTYSGLIR